MLTIFGRCELYTFDSMAYFDCERGWSMVYCPGNEAAWTLQNLKQMAFTAIRRRNNSIFWLKWTEEMQKLKYAKRIAQNMLSTRQVVSTRK